MALEVIDAGMGRTGTMSLKAAPGHWLDQTRDGWEPMCRFLDVPVPEEDFPHLNDAAWFRERAGLPAI